MKISSAVEKVHIIAPFAPSTATTPLACGAPSIPAPITKSAIESALRCTALGEEKVVTVSIKVDHVCVCASKRKDNRHKTKESIHLFIIL